MAAVYVTRIRDTTRQRGGSAVFGRRAGFEVLGGGCAAALLCLLTWANTLAQEQSRSLDRWAQRFHRDRQLVKEPGLLAQVAVPAGFVLLGQTEEAIRIGSKMDPQQEYRSLDDVLLEVAGLLSRIDRLDEALDTTARLSSDARRRSAIAHVAHGQVHRGDLADGLRLISKLSASDQNSLAETIIQQELDSRTFASASEHLALVSDEKRRARLKQMVDEARSLPAPEEASYVERKVEAARRQLRERRSSLKGAAPEGAEEAATPDAEGEIKLLSCLAKAKHLNATRKPSDCRRELRAAWGLVSQIEQEDRKVGEQIVVAITAFQCGAPDLAKEWLAASLQNPKVDGMLLEFTWDSVKPMAVMAEVLTENELQPAVERWRKQVDLPLAYLQFAGACGKLQRFERLEWLHSQTESAELRLALDATAMEWILRRGK